LLLRGDNNTLQIQFTDHRLRHTSDRHQYLKLADGILTEPQNEHPPQCQHLQGPRAAAAVAATAAAAMAAAAAAAATAAAAAAESATATVEAETPGKGDAARMGRGYHQSQQTPQRGQPTGGE
ncbi:hypothetical protein CLOP_g1374, partial [Closterium sp. NIES-67]